VNLASFILILMHSLARLNAYLFAPIHKKNGPEELNEELEAAHEAGFVGAVFVDR
jgi:hypothetical protein